MGSVGRWLLTLVVVIVASGTAFTAGVAAERQAVLPGSIHTQPPRLTEPFSPFWEAWELVEKHFVDRASLDPKEMTYGAIEGMISTLGDQGHTRFLTPEEAQIQRGDISGEFFGIGAELGTREGHPVIVAPLDGSPAQGAGILAGDLLVEVDGQPVAGMSTEQIVRLVRGPEGTQVTLKVVHPGQSTLTDIAITRARIQMRPVSWAMLPGTDVAMLRINQFSANTAQDTIDALKAIKEGNARALILDVRSNTGGLLDQCIAVTSQFVSGGNVLVEQDAQGNRKAHKVQPGGIATEIPMVVLIDQGTASAAEIFAGAIQDQGRAKVVGETSFGTGTVLTPFSLSDGSALFLGTSEWLTPNGRQIWKQGIIPDEVVALPAGSAGVTPRSAGEMTPEQLRSSQDAQVQKALELLKQ